MPQLRALFAALADIRRVAWPYFRSDDRWAGWILLAAVIGLEDLEAQPLGLLGPVFGALALDLVHGVGVVGIENVVDVTDGERRIARTHERLGRLREGAFLQEGTTTGFEAFAQSARTSHGPLLLRLVGSAQHFPAALYGFSPNVKQILDNFECCTRIRQSSSTLTSFCWTPPKAPLESTATMSPSLA